MEKEENIPLRNIVYPYSVFPFFLSLPSFHYCELGTGTRGNYPIVLGFKRGWKENGRETKEVMSYLITKGSLEPY